MVQTVFDIEETVGQLMEYERQKQLLTYQDKKAEYTNAQRSIDKVDSSMEALEDVLKTLTKQSTFMARETTTTDSSVVTASSAVGASEILFDITVNSLAQAATVSSDSDIGLLSGSFSTLTSTDELNTTGGIDVDPNATFESGSTNLETSVTAGYFTINDKQITVLDSDTVNTVLSKINSSGAGVVAEYDDTQDKIIVTATDVGSDGDITISDGTSNFATAAKLTGATVSTGDDAYLYQNLADIGIGVSDGYLTINNITFQIDAANDSVNDVLSRINSSSAGVSIFYSQQTDKLTVISDEEGKNIEMSNDTSGFLAAMNVLDNAGDTDATVGKSTYEFTQGSVTVNGSTIAVDENNFELNGTTFSIVSTGNARVDVEADEEAAVEAVSNFVEQYNQTLSIISDAKEDDSSGVSNYRAMRNIERQMKTFIYSSIDNSGDFARLVDIGIKMGSSNNSSGVRTLQLDESALRSALNTSFDGVFKLFAEDTDNDGLYDDKGLSNTINDYMEDYTRGTLGIFAKRKKIIDNSIDRMDDKIEKEEYRLLNLEQLLTNQYRELNKALSQLDTQIQTSNYMAMMAG